MSRILTFNGKTSSSFGLRIGCPSVYNASGRDVSTYYVPGRIGAVYPALDYSQIPNEVKEYNAALYMRADSMEQVERKMEDIRDWLMNVDGYAELTDSYEPQFYRRAFFTGGFAPVRKGAGQNFEIPLRFSCDPRRFLTGTYNFEVHGARVPVTYTTPATVNGFSIREGSKPLIYISKDAVVATITFTDVTVHSGTPANVELGKIYLSGDEADFYFDAESLTAYDESGDPCNQYITDVTGEIRLGPGQTEISINTSEVALTVTPRWWVR